MCEITAVGENVLKNIMKHMVGKIPELLAVPLETTT